IGIVPDIIQVPIKIPMDMRIRMAGIARLTFSCIPFIISSHENPRRRAINPAYTEESISSGSGFNPNTPKPIASSSSITAIGENASNKFGFLFILCTLSLIQKSLLRVNCRSQSYAFLSQIHVQFQRYLSTALISQHHFLLESHLCLRVSGPL